MNEVIRNAILIIADKNQSVLNTELVKTNKTYKVIANKIDIPDLIEPISRKERRALRYGKPNWKNKFSK
jgi:hypothetical protein